MHRREFIATAGSTTVVGLSGCSRFLTTKSGTLVIDNNRDQAHTVEVILSKMSDSARGETPSRLPPPPSSTPPSSVHPTSSASTRTKRRPPRRSRPPPAATPIWKREHTYRVSSGETVKKSGFIDEAGTYYLKARLDTGETVAMWNGWSSAGEGVSGGYIDIRINKGGSSPFQMELGFDD